MIAFHLASELLGCSCDFKTQVPVVLPKLTRRFQHHRKNFSHLAGATTGEESDEIRITLRVDFPALQSFDHGMTNKQRAQVRLVVGIDFKGKMQSTRSMESPFF